MRFFCMDLHISVIADFKSANPDVEVVDWCLSGHAWVMGREQDYPEFINPNTWKYLNKEMIEKFQEHYDAFLRSFDGFIVGFASSFALIYERYNKPIIMLNAVRYDIPFCWTNDHVMLDEWHSCLQRLHEKRLLTVVSNNRADQAYTEKGSGITSCYIPSLCLYTKATYTPMHSTFLCLSDCVPSHPLVSKKTDLPKPHNWQDIANFRGIIVIPYEVSLMSLFEQFSAGIPFFFPSKRFWKENPNIQSMSAYWAERIPPRLNEFKNPEAWIERSDLYEIFQSPNTYYFDSYEHLFSQLESFIYNDDRSFRNQHIHHVLRQWNILLDSIISKSFWNNENRHLSYNRLPLLANVMYDADYTGSGVSPQYDKISQKEISSGDIVFVKTDFLHWFLENQSPCVTYTLVTGVSDITPSQEVCERILADSNIVRWIGCNIPVRGEKIRKVLIGVGEKERENGNHEKLIMLHNSRVPWQMKSRTICVPFHSSTHASRVVESTLPKLPFEEYMREISQRQFVVCMRGNGMDTHRFCEILLMGSVPIVEHSPLDDLYSQFPCIICDSFSNVSIENFQWDESKYSHFLDMFWLRDGLREYLI